MQYYDGYNFSNGCRATIWMSSAICEIQNVVFACYAKESIFKSSKKSYWQPLVINMFIRDWRNVQCINNNIDFFHKSLYLEGQ